MASVYVRFECKEDLELLSRLVDNTVVRLQARPDRFCDIAESMYRVVDSLHSAAPLNEAHLLGVPEDVIETDKRSQPGPKPRKPRGSSGVKSKALALCPTHTAYQAKQVPRHGCEGCWAAYKKFNPTKYSAARRKFDRLQNKNNEA